MIVLACILIFLEVEARRISRATTEIFQKISQQKITHRKVQQGEVHWCP